MANNEKINENVLDQLLVEVTNEISDYLRKDEADLRKAAGDEGPSPSDEESEGSSGPAAPAESAAPPMDEASAPTEASAPAPEAAPEMAPEGSADPMAAQGDQAIEPAPSVEALMAEYQKLDPEALRMHYLAAKQALMAAMGAGQPEPSAPMAPEASAPAAPAPMAPEASAPPMAMKGEMSAGKDMGDLSDGANGGEMTAGSKLGKSEKDAEIEDLRAKLAKNEEQILELAMRLTAPLRKSVKGISELPFITTEGGSVTKTSVEGLSKPEIIAKLREKSRDGSLKKSDREKINAFTLGDTTVTVKDLEHLLAE